MVLQCVPVPGKGFQSGSYICECHDGFYFPDLDADTKAFKGSDIEMYFSRSNAKDSTKKSDKLQKFQCLPCAEGCDTCVDDSPCP